MSADGGALMPELGRAARGCFHLYCADGAETFGLREFLAVEEHTYSLLKLPYDDSVSQEVYKVELSRGADTVDWPTYQRWVARQILTHRASEQLMAAYLDQIVKIVTSSRKKPVAASQDPTPALHGRAPAKRQEPVLGGVPQPRLALEPAEVQQGVEEGKAPGPTRIAENEPQRRNDVQVVAPAAALPPAPAPAPTSTATQGPADEVHLELAGPLLRHFVIVARAADAGARPAVRHHASFPRGTDTHPPSAIENFCFPGAQGDATPDGGVSSLQYTFVQTLDGGVRQYGFCYSLRSAADGGCEVLCAVSSRPWFEFFSGLMEALASRRKGGGGVADLEQMIDAVTKHTDQSPISPGARFSVPLLSGQALSLKAPAHNGIGDGAEYETLFKTLSVPCISAIFVSLLSEQRVLFVSSSLSKLSTCVHSLLALIEPFTWQHIFVPIMPQSMLDYITAPMPYVIGVHDSLLEEVGRLPEDDSVVWVYLDSDEVRLCMDSLFPLPPILKRSLEARMCELVGKLSSSKMSIDEFQGSIALEFLNLMLDVFGNYREYTIGPDFDFNRFCKGSDSVATREFLHSFRETQIFERWCSHCSDAARCGYQQEYMTRFDSMVSSGARNNGQGLIRRARRRLSSISLAAGTPRAANTPRGDEAFEIAAVNKAPDGDLSITNMNDAPPRVAASTPIGTGRFKPKEACATDGIESALCADCDIQLWQCATR
eukprot:COSAG05_NODE_1984_length_3746_cov_3.101430_2_plen_716_part_00